MVINAFRSCLALCATLLFAAGLLFPSVVSAQVEGGAVDSAGVDSAEVNTIGGVPVIFRDDTLLTMRHRLGSFTPKDRAEAISSRLKRIADDPLLEVGAFEVIESESSSDIVAGDVTIMSVTDRDAESEGIGRPFLAKKYALAFQHAFDAERESATLETILLGSLYALLVTIALILLIRLVGRLYARLYVWLDEGRETQIRSLSFRNFEVISGDRVVDLLLGLLRLLRLGAVILLIYLYLPLVFSFFPWTQGLAAQLFGYISTPISTIFFSLIGYLPSLFKIIATIAITYYVLKGIRYFFSEAHRGSIEFPGFPSDWALPTYKIIRFLIIVLVAVIIFPYLPGAGSPAFEGIGLFLTLMISLASASAIANIIAGVVLTYTRAFVLGDRVKIADTVGDVVGKSLLVTRVRTIKNVDVTIPNAMVLSSHIINYSSSVTESTGLLLHTGVTIGYDVPWRDVHELLRGAAQGSEYVLEDPAPFVLQTSLDDWYVSYELNAYTLHPGKMAVIYSDLHERIQDAFNEAGVEIMSPHYQTLRDGNQTTIPASYLPKGYVSPSFQFMGGRKSEDSSGENKSDE